MGSPSDTGPTPPNGNSNNSNNNNNNNNSPPPYRTRSITRRQDKAPPNRPRPRPTYYQPQVHQFTCRGAFHLKKDVDVNNNPNRSDPPKYNNDNITSAKEAERQSREYLEDMIKDTFVCQGIQTRLKHVADYPLARSKEEAINWFQGVEGQPYMTSSPGIGGSANNNDRGNNGRGNHKNQNKNQKHEEETDVVSSDDADSFSSYGTTQVNILTLQEIPGISSEEMQPSVFDDPFGGFGDIPATGIFNPFGSLFGAFGAPSPWDMASPQDGANANANAGGNKSWMRAGSRSVSSSTRTHRDGNGKRVVTTVTETVTVDDNGKRKTETETTVRHLDDGGRVETKKEVHAEDGDDVGNGDELKNSSRAPRVAPSAPMFGPPAIVAPAGPPTSPPEVAVIDTETLFGVAITDAAGQHPDDVDYQPNQRGGDGSGWRRTEFLFRLGRFIPPFMLVSQYYDSRGAEAKRNKEEYDRVRQRVKKERLDNTKGRDKDGNEVDGSAAEDVMPNSLPNYGALSSSNRMQEFLEKLREQMEKNARMMQIIGKEVIKPDFPGKVKMRGEKIIDNFGPTAERAMKLASDVFEMWTGWSGDEGNNGRRR
mmetsp:Transcript_3705/g.8326  ORF Transcript_3705/g.8326 Transcript_3705/m.8326 type:complete len:595 (+) Transcript_3705:114-1898(+)